MRMCSTLASETVSEPHRGHHTALALAKPYGVYYTRAYLHHNKAHAITSVKMPLLG